MCDRELCLGRWHMPGCYASGEGGGGGLRNLTDYHSALQYASGLQLCCLFARQMPGTSHVYFCIGFRMIPLR